MIQVKQQCCPLLFWPAQPSVSCVALYAANCLAVIALPAFSSRCHTEAGAVLAEKNVRSISGCSLLNVV
jgi:hypothetical protein